MDAMQSLRMFFVDALHNNVAHAGSKEDDAGSRFLAFVRKQYVKYLDSLVALLQSKTSVKTQLGAMIAILEAVRAQSVTEFENSTFKPLVSAVLTSKHVHSEILSTFISKCSTYADMRFYALQHVSQLSAKLAKHEPSAKLQVCCRTHLEPPWFMHIFGEMCPVITQRPGMNYVGLLFCWTVSGNEHMPKDSRVFVNQMTHLLTLLALPCIPVVFNLWHPT